MTLGLCQSCPARSGRETQHFHFVESWCFKKRTKFGIEHSYSWLCVVSWLLYVIQVRYVVCTTSKLYACHKKPLVELHKRLQSHITNNDRVNVNFMSLGMPS